MKRFFFSFFILIFTFLVSFQQSQALDISVKHAKFRTSEIPYVEVYLYIIGSSCMFDSIEHNQLKAEIEFIITFENNNVIEAFDKFVLNATGEKRIKDFMALKRFGLKNGTYNMQIEARDLLDTLNTFSFKEEIDVSFNPQAVQLSDIQLLNSFSRSIEPGEFDKAGFFLQQAPFHYFSKDDNQLGAYLEVYNPANDPFKAAYLKYTIYQKQGEDERISIMEKYKKLDSKSTQPLLLQFSIKNLFSGNYEFVVELRNKEQRLVDVKSVDFQRSKPSMDELEAIERNIRSFEASFVQDLSDQEVRYSLKAIAPILQGQQSLSLEELFISGDNKNKRYFLYSFFQEELANDPGFAYKEFMKVATAVDKTYRSNVGYGFETDRGRIFIKYGKPTEIVEVEDEPTAPPYEIWFYSSLDNSKQYNVKFIFHNPSLANNDYVLLHSNCRGERNNPRWEVDLYSSAPNEQTGNNSASTQMNDNYRRNARKIWDEL